MLTPENERSVRGEWRARAGGTAGPQSWQARAVWRGLLGSAPGLAPDVRVAEFGAGVPTGACAPRLSVDALVLVGTSWY
jgi:hypothetical protein